MDNLKKLSVQVSSVSLDVKALEGQVSKFELKMNKRFDKVMTHLDGLAKGFKKFDEEQVILSAHSRDHNDRIEKLENAVFLTS